MGQSSWVNQAIKKIEADYNRSADTHLIPVMLPGTPDIQLYLKDESTHPTGSLKHRLARSLFLYALCNGNIQQDTPIIEASSGSTAISEAYFAKLLGLRFIAVIPQGTSQQKIDQIGFYGGECHFVENGSIYEEASQLAASLNGHYMDQFTFAERATDWRGNNNIAESIFMQMEKEPNPEPAWIVTSAGTGGTSATLGRYINFKGYATKLCVADPSHSVFYDYYQSGDKSLTISTPSAIEGIGRPRVEPSFVRSVIDHMMRVPDEAAFATIDFLQSILNRKCGPSTGTNVFAALQLISQMQVAGETGSVVTMICDAGERYRDTCYNPQWLARHHDCDAIRQYREQLLAFYQTGRFG
ncbi:PLP-dependent cysteine synthase family protein [Alteromonas sp. CYL-A6]|uniref:PLP-dependent cysteine synthase family protein n=1 Tax=Alteromonas nitratireducens TaxID=3390813 RepID=UPI0034BA4D19